MQRCVAETPPDLGEDLKWATIAQGFQLIPNSDHFKLGGKKQISTEILNLGLTLLTSVVDLASKGRFAVKIQVVWLHRHLFRGNTAWRTADAHGEA